MNNKAKMYQNKINKVFNNNMTVYNSYDKNYYGYEDSILNTVDVKRKINDIMKANNFVYCKLVHIIINDEDIVRKIIGVNNNSLITIDNEYIPIDNIKDIYVK